MIKKAKKKEIKEMKVIKGTITPKEKFETILEPELKRKENPKPHSKGIKVVSIICFIISIIYFITGILLIYNKDLLSPLPNFNFAASLPGVYYIMAGAVIIFALIYAFIGYGLFKRKRSAAITLIIICGLNVIASTFSIINGSLVSILNLLFNLALGGYVFYVIKKS